jgi:hypothetical protein
MHSESIDALPVVARPQAVELKPAPDAIRQFFRRRLDAMRAEPERGAVDLNAAFTAAGAILASFASLKQALGFHEQQTAEEPSWKVWAKTAGIVVAFEVIGLTFGSRVGAEVQTYADAKRPIPAVTCVSVPPPASTAKGYLRIGTAAEQTASSILPLPEGMSCDAAKSVVLRQNLETSLGGPDGACIDIELDGKEVRSYITTDRTRPFVDVRLRENTTCEPSTDIVLTRRPLGQSTGIGG